MCSLTTAHIYVSSPVGRLYIYICETSRLHIGLFLGFKIYLQLKLIAVWHLRMASFQSVGIHFWQNLSAKKKL